MKKRLLMGCVAVLGLVGATGAATIGGGGYPVTITVTGIPAGSGVTVTLYAGYMADVGQSSCVEDNTECTGTVMLESTPPIGGSVQGNARFDYEGWHWYGSTRVTMSADTQQGMSMTVQVAQNQPINP